MIYLIGNSHVRGFIGSMFYQIHLGPVIAYNFMEHHMQKVRNYLTSIDQINYISLVVGEVDCRLHLPKQADEQKRTDEDVTKECITKITKCYEEIESKGYNIIVFATHPTTIEEHDLRKADRPIYGSCKRRNNICCIWNQELEQVCKDKGWKFISIYKHLVDENGLTKMEYFEDYCHLNATKTVPFLLQELNDETF